MSKSSIQKLSSNFQRELSHAASAFLQEGLATFHRARIPPLQQVALVNIAVACELLTKAYLAKKSLSLVFSDLSPEEMVTLQFVKDISAEAQSPVALKLKFREFRFRTFSDCLSMLYTFKPALRSEYGSALFNLGSIRNAGVHSAISSNAVHDIDRSAYVALKLFQEIRSDAGSFFYQKPADVTFLKRFSEAQNTKVRKALDTARRIFRSKAFVVTHSESDGWDEYLIDCPVCDCHALVTGTTENEGDLVGPDEYEETLNFYATSFACNGCKLKLSNEEEMRLAGVDRIIDRSADLDGWHESHYDDDQGYEE